MADQNDTKVKIEGISGDNPFKVPDFYFEHLSSRIADRISTTEESEFLVSSRAWWHPRYAFITLTSLVIMLVVGIHTFHNDVKPAPTESEISQNIEYSIISDMDEDDLVHQLVSVESKSALPADSIAEARQEYSKQVIEYLSKEDIDMNTIEDAL